MAGGVSKLTEEQARWTRRLIEERREKFRQIHAVLDNLEESGHRAEVEIESPTTIDGVDVARFGEATRWTFEVPERPVTNFS